MIVRLRSSAERPWRSKSAARFFMPAVNTIPSTALILANFARPSVGPFATRRVLDGERRVLDGEPCFFIKESYHRLLQMALARSQRPINSTPDVLCLRRLEMRW